MKIIDFVTRTGEKIGEVKAPKLAEYVLTSERKIRFLKEKNKLMFDCLYLGAFCHANNIKKEDIKSLLESNCKEK